MNAPPLLGVEGLRRYFPAPRGGTVKAVEDVSLELAAGETLGLVGESGCGKSTTGRMIVGLDRPTAGSIVFEGRDVSALTPAQWRATRRRIQIIFQNPLSSLDPRLPIGRQIREPLDIHGIGTVAERESVVAELMAAVSLAPEIAARYPHQISGGQAQRAVIARALTLQPRLIVCDEAVSALDVSVQGMVIALLETLRRERGLSYLFISHDLRVVKQLCHRVSVMYLGQIVEEGPTGEVYGRPLHPYTMALISAVPDLARGKDRPPRLILKGEPPSPSRPPEGCHFHTRCGFARERCRVERPLSRQIRPGHRVRCHFAEEIGDKP